MTRPRTAMRDRAALFYFVGTFTGALGGFCFAAAFLPLR